jgi:inorganic pyrophosphatase
MGGALHCLVEIPKGSRNKYEWDPELGAIKLDRFLFSSVVFPTDYGFIKDTMGEDGDPLDAMVCVSAPTFPGCVIPVDAVAVFRMTDDKGQDDKVLCEIEHFFAIYEEREGKEVAIEGWYGRDRALEIVDESRQRWQEERG